jgi:hypothetical protein
MLVACRLAGLSALEAYYAGRQPAGAMQTPRATPTRPHLRVTPGTPRLSRTGRGVSCDTPQRPGCWRPDLSAQFFLADSDAEVASRYADIANTDFHAPRDAIVLAQLRCPLAGTDLKSLARNLQPRPEAVLVEAAAGRKDRVVDNDPALRHVGGAGRGCPQIPLGALIDNSELQRLHGPCVGGTLRPLGRFLAMAR